MERGPAEVGTDGLEELVEGLLHAPHRQAEVVGLLTLVVLPVGGLVVGVEAVDDVELGERREEAGTGDRRAAELRHQVEAVRHARAGPQRRVGLALGGVGQVEERDRGDEYSTASAPAVRRLLTSASTSDCDACLLIRSARTTVSPAPLAAATRL